MSATVKLGTQSIPIERPASAAVRGDCIALIGRVGVNATSMAAALGACSPRLQRRLKVSIESSGYDLARFGHSIYDALIAGQVPAVEVYEAGGAALRLLVESEPTEAEVAATEDFFGEPVEPTS